MKELNWVRVQYASRQQCSKTHKRLYLLPFRDSSLFFYFLFFLEIAVPLVYVAVVSIADSMPVLAKTGHVGSIQMQPNVG